MHAALSVRPIEPVGPVPGRVGPPIIRGRRPRPLIPVSNVCNLPAEQIGRCCRKVARVPQRSAARPRPNHAVGRSTGPEDPHPVWEEFREDEHDLLSGPIRVKTHCPHFSVRAFRLEACLAEALCDSQSLGGGHLEAPGRDELGVCGSIGRLLPIVGPFLALEDLASCCGRRSTKPTGSTTRKSLYDSKQAAYLAGTYGRIRIGPRARGEIGHFVPSSRNVAGSTAPDSTRSTPSRVRCCS